MTRGGFQKSRQKGETMHQIQRLQKIFEIQKETMDIPSLLERVFPGARLCQGSAVKSCSPFPIRVRVSFIPPGYRAFFIFTAFIVHYQRIGSNTCYALFSTTS